MKRNIDIEVEYAFTNKVKEYIDKDYVFNTKTMAGLGHELCRVDLKHGCNFVRIWLTNVFSSSIGNHVVLKVGGLKMDKGIYETIFTDELEIIEEIEL